MYNDNFWNLETFFQEGKSVKFSILGRLGNASSWYGTSSCARNKFLALALGEASLI
jgi:hypothetical protein